MMEFENILLEEEGQYLKLSDIGAYRISFKLSNFVWEKVIQWGYFEKDTIGKQFVRAVDSISANIAEGFGRYGKKEKIQFFRYSFGSMKEALDWNEKAKIRNLLSEEDYNHIFTDLQKLPREINYLIRYTNEKLKH
jgi:four helix bundle protein